MIATSRREFIQKAAGFTGAAWLLAANGATLRGESVGPTDWNPGLSFESDAQRLRCSPGRWPRSV